MSKIQTFKHHPLGYQNEIEAVANSCQNWKLHWKEFVTIPDNSSSHCVNVFTKKTLKILWRKILFIPPTIWSIINNVFLYISSMCLKIYCPTNFFCYFITSGDKMFDSLYNLEQIFSFHLFCQKIHFLFQMQVRW